jgi:putative transposase
MRSRPRSVNSTWPHRDSLKWPNLTPICERFLGSVRRECLDHVLILGEDHLRSVLEEYVHAYFNIARPHQGLGQQIPGVVDRPPDDFSANED